MNFKKIIKILFFHITSHINFKTNKQKEKQNMGLSKKGIKLLMKKGNAQALIIDNGTGFTKAGFAGYYFYLLYRDDGPRCKLKK
jgi:hypothetical protein